MRTTGGGTITPEAARRVRDAIFDLTTGRGSTMEALLDDIVHPDPALAETEMDAEMAEADREATAIELEEIRGGHEVDMDILLPKLAEELRVWEKAGLMLADLDALRARFVPAEGETVAEEEFIQRGVDLVAVGRNTFIVLGELLQWKMDAERCETEPSRNAVIERYGPMWGVSTSALWKAWTYANRFPGLILPEDTSQTLAYEVISGCRTREEAEEVLNRALSEGWSVKDVREIKSLRSRGLLKEWERLKLIVKDHILYVRSGDGRMIPCATFGVAGEGPDHDWARAGIALLEMRAGL